jgi:hypothetical protein
MWMGFSAVPAVLLLAVPLAAAQNPVSDPHCSDQVCSINIFSEKLIAPPCTGYTVVAAYSIASGATAIECSKFLEEEDDRIFIFDRLHKGTNAFEFTGGKIISSLGLQRAAKNNQIPDKFAARPFCTKEHPVPGAGQITFIEKLPTNNDDSPYCYRVYYVATDSNFEVRSAAGDELKPASEEDAKKWAPIREKLAPYLVAPKPATADESKTASVSSDKAVLYGSPNSDSPGRMYLVKGDKVEIVDDSRAQQGWYLIHYVARSGKSIEKWIRARDLSREPITR